MEYLLSFLLIVLSALFSGLTLGYFTLNQHDLKRQAKLGNEAAKRIYPLRKHGNQLLTTLLLGNVIVNTTLSIYLGSFLDGVLAGVIATTLIVIFGEITPQAIIARHALQFGALVAPGVRLVMWLLAPIAWPIAKTLDHFLGNETPRTYSKHEIMHIVSEHEDSEHSPIDADEERIVHGALQFSHRKVREVMTPLSEVVMFEVGQRLTRDFYKTVTTEGYSRYPVYRGNRENIIGILYTKDLLVEEDEISIAATEEALETTFLRVKPSDYLDTALAKMLKQKKHLAIVYNRNQVPLGVVSLEDIIEEIIQFEIEDEDDEDVE